MWKGPGADSEEKHEPVSDIDTVMVDGLKALDPEWPIREADFDLRSCDVADVLRPRHPLHTSGGLANGAQDATAFDRERLGQLSGEVRRRQQRHDGKIGEALAQCESRISTAGSITLARIWREVLLFTGHAFPFLGVRGRLLLRGYIGPCFSVLGIDPKPLLQPRCGVRLDRFNWTFGLAHPAIDAFIRMDDEHVLALVETIHGTNLDTIHQFALDTTVIDDIGQIRPPRLQLGGNDRPRAARECESRNRAREFIVPINVDVILASSKQASVKRSALAIAKGDSGSSGPSSAVGRIPLAVTLAVVEDGT
jgi:hypothetical protein